MADTTLPLPVIGSLLFMLSGPIGVIPLFAGLTATADDTLRRKIAVRGFLIAVVAMSLAVFAGAGAMANAGTQTSSLIIAAGVILTLTALRNILGTHAPPAGEPAPASLALATSPLAVPGLMSPLGVAVLIIFVSLFPAMSDKLAVYALALAILVANLGAMLIAHWFMRVIGMGPLIVLGAVFGVLQVGLGIEMIRDGLKLG